jgi:hypothetical protein
MKKAFGLAILASLLAAPAFAGETFVRNEDFWSDSVTKTDLYLDSHTNSTRTEDYSSWADKIYIDGEVEFSKCDKKCGSTEIAFDELTVHKAGAELEGTFTETKDTYLYGSIESTTNAYTDGHETSAGVR